MDSIDRQTFPSRRIDERIRAVVFDAVGTLLYACPSVTTVYCDVIGNVGTRPLEPERVRSVLMRRLAARTTDPDQTTSEAAERRFWFDVIAELVANDAKNQSCFDRLYYHFGRPEHWHCYDDVAETLERLRKSHLKLAIASNFDERLHRVCSGHADLTAITSRIVSSEVGWRKPAPQFFEIVCRELNCRPEDILFVGDDLRSDVQGAAEAGMQAVWIDRRGQLPGEIGFAASENSDTTVWRIQSLRELC